MAEWFASGRLFDLVILVAIAEWAALTGLWLACGVGVSPRAAARLLAPGVCLMLAARIAVVGAWWGWGAGALTAALAFHLWDVSARWRRLGSARPGS